MATQTFNLNDAIENWRNELAAQPQITPDDRRELEKHLTDTMAELRDRGLNEEESFWLAQRRVGQPQQLADEFHKGNPAGVWRERVFWMVAAVLVFQIWTNFSYSLLNLLSVYLGPNFQLYSLSPLPLIVINVLPYVLALVLIARGYLNRASEKLSAIFRSQIHLAFMAVLVVTLSSFGAALATFYFRLAMWDVHPPTSESLFILTTQNMMVPLIFVPLLCLLMPKKPNSPKRA